MWHGAGWWSFIHDDGKRPQVTRGLLLRVLGYARPYTPQIALLLFLIFLTSVLGLITPLIFRDLIDYTLPQGDIVRLNLFALALIALPVISGVLRVFQRQLNSGIGEGLIYDLRVALYTHLQKMSLRFFTNTKTGELMSRLNSDVVDAQSAVNDTIVGIITNVVSVVMTLIVMIAMDWRLTVLGLAVLPLFVFAARRIGTILRKYARDQMRYNAQMNAMMNETLNISGALLVKLFGRSKQEVSRFDDRAGKVRDIGVSRAVVGARFFVVIGLISAVGTALVYWLGGHLVIQGIWQTGTIVAFGTYLANLYGPLQALVNAPVEFATSMVSFERVFEVLDLPIEIAEQPNAVTLTHVTGRIEFQDVTFEYGKADQDVLSNVVRYENDEYTAFSDFENTTKKPAASNGSQAREIALNQVSLTIQPGQIAALVGRSGAGKTTMTYLIPRLYDPTSGKILIDGHDLREVTLDSLAAQIGMVTQETYLFHDTIRMNLLYAKMDATQTEIEAACKAANIHDFITGLPEGYESIVGERGYRLSGGEKQRLALARVILKNPRILVLDEATSSLDSQSEALIQDALKTVMQGRTSIVIAHRLSTILSADVIFVMDRGQVLEQGKHDDLLARGGLYTTLYETQFGGQRVETSEPTTVYA